MADAGPSGRARLRREDGTGSREVGRHGHLEVVRVAGKHMDGDGTGLEQGGLVGPAACPRRLARQRGTKEIAADALRGLGHHELVAVDGRHHQVALDPLDGLGHRDGRDGCAVALDGGHHRVHQRAVEARPGAVVDEHGSGPARVWSLGLEGREPRRHRRVPVSAALDHAQHGRRQPRGPLQLRDSLGGRHDHDGIDGGRRREGVEGVGEQRPTGHLPRQLVEAIHAAGAAGGHDDRVGDTAAGHGDLSRVGAGRRSSGRRRSGGRA
jgi:hypothetical protein